MRIPILFRTLGRWVVQGLALLILAAVVIYLTATIAMAAGTIARLVVTHPTQYIDDSPLPASAIRETLIEWRRTAAGPVVGTVRLAGTATTIDVPGLVCGDFVFVAYTITTNNQQSGATVPPTPYATGIACSPKSPGLSAS